MIRRAMLIAMLAAGAGAVAAEPATEPAAEPKPSLLKRGATVDKPIPETYEPLNSTYVEGGEKLNESIEQSWELKKKAKEQQEQAVQPPVPTPERQALEQRIDEPGGEATAPPLPKLQTQEKAIRISEP